MSDAIEHDDDTIDLRCFIAAPPPPPTTIDVTDVVHIATLVTLQLRDAIVLRGRTDVVAALDDEDVRSQFLDDVVLITQRSLAELGEGSGLELEMAAIKRDDIGRAAGFVIAEFDTAPAGDDTLDTSARG